MYVMRIGKWSEPSSCSVFHVERSVMSGVANVMSGDVCCVCMLNGLRVGVCGLFNVMYVSSCVVIVSARVSVCCVISHVGSCALKSPRIRELVRVLRCSK